MFCTQSVLRVVTGTVKDNEAYYGDYDYSVATASKLVSNVSNNVHYTHSLAFQRENAFKYICWVIIDSLAESLFIHKHDVYPSSK